MSEIRLWYGTRQYVGGRGWAQEDVNLLGEVTRPDALVEFTCAVGGRTPPWPLTVGRDSGGFGDGRRLALAGHFNADIPRQCLTEGENEILLRARWSTGERVDQPVTVIVEDGRCPLPCRINWQQVTDPQQVGLPVDGEWRVEGDTLRTAHTGYDRVFLIGDATWQDVEVLVPVTIHRVDAQTGPVSGGNGVGLLYRFAGHVTGGPRRFPPGQPKWGYQPFGAITWLRFMDGASHPPQKQFYRGDRDEMVDSGVFPIMEGATYWMRGQCVTEPDVDGEGVSLYRLRVWADGDPEPTGWDIEQRQQSAAALRRGGVVLLAHHVDAAFGSVDVRACEPG